MSWMNSVIKAYQAYGSTSRGCCLSPRTGGGDSKKDVYWHVWRTVERAPDVPRVIIKMAAGVHWSEIDKDALYKTNQLLSRLLFSHEVDKWLMSYGDWLIGKPCSGVEYAKKFGGCARNYQSPKNRHLKKFKILDDLAADAINDVINASIENRARLKEAERVPL